MRRDNNHCMITGLEDSSQPDGEVVVQTAHIIPQSINKNIGERTVRVYGVFPPSIDDVVVIAVPICRSVVNPGDLWS